MELTLSVHSDTGAVLLLPGARAGNVVGWNKGMARKTQIMLEDDLTGDVLADGAGETVAFAFEGINYEIDLSTENAAQLREDVARYAGAGRKVGASTGRKSGGSMATASQPAPVRRSDLAAIREWARANGHEVSDRGRIAASVVEACDAAR